MYKKIIGFLMIFFVFATTIPTTIATAPVADFTINAKSAVLIEMSTGKILYDQNKDEPLPPASVTKIMTMLLTLEAVERGELSLDDIVTASEAAKNLGGSQINLNTGEQMTVYDLMMSTAVASANDASLALGEHIAGSEDAFVDMMNLRAIEIGMGNTNFENPHGLPAENHYSSAYDAALMSRRLIETPLAIDFTSTQTYTIRADSNPYQMRNSNALLASYPGMIGVKTGSTDEAGYCLSTAVTRDGMTLIAVILGAPSTSVRNSEMTKLLDYGFANYEMYEVAIEPFTISEIEVAHGVSDSVAIINPTMSIEPQVIQKGTTPTIVQEVDIPDVLTAPVEENQKIGNIKVYLDGKLIADNSIKTASAVEKMHFFKALEILIKSIVTL